MKITEQQLLVLFDIAKSCLYHPDKQFAGYKKEEIGKLINDIINQQDNNKFIEKIDINVTDYQEKDLSLNNKIEEDFWDEKND